MPRPVYSDDFKRTVGLRYLSGESLRSIAREVGVHRNSLNAWLSQGFCYSNWNQYVGDRSLFYMAVGSTLFGFERVKVGTPNGPRWGLVLKADKQTLPVLRSASWHI